MPDTPTGGDLRGRLHELERVRRHDLALRDVIRAFAGDLSSTLNLPASLSRLCGGAAPLFDAHRVAAWMHDRRARDLVFEASSDPAPPEVTRISLATAARSPIAAALRQERPAFLTLEGVRALAVPLRGRRRALGLLLFERLGPGPLTAPDLLEQAAELGRQVSATIENTVLFEDVLRSRRELENTFNSLTDLVVVCDRDLRVANANRAFRERTAAAGGETNNRPIVEVVGPELGAWLRRLKFTTAPPGREFTIDITDPVLGGRFAVRATPLHGPDRGVLGLVVVARDRTQELRLEAERAALGERLAQAEKLAALGQFVAGVAHELNNPLQGVLGHVELIRARGPVPRSILPELRVVRREAERAAKIVNNLLVFAGSRRGTRRRVNLNGIATRTVSMRSRAARAGGIEIIRRLARNLPPVRGNAHLLQQALLNVVLNAEHAVAGGSKRGRIRITTRAEKRGTVAALEIEDNGPGIPPDVLPRIFDPFFTTKEVGQGTGLGLAIVYGIVHDHGGEITAGNRRGGGAVFRLVLPGATIKSRPGS